MDIAKTIKDFSESPVVDALSRFAIPAGFIANGVCGIIGIPNEAIRKAAGVAIGCLIGSGVLADAAILGSMFIHDNGEEVEVEQ